jgi:hypothetical protein
VKSLPRHGMLVPPNLRMHNRSDLGVTATAVLRDLQQPYIIRRDSLQRFAGWSARCVRLKLERDEGRLAFVCRIHL